MAFLRLSRRRVAAIKSAKRQSLEQERDDWIAQRQAAMRSPSVELLGKTFATKRKAAEYGKRLVTGKSGWKSGGYLKGEGQLLSPVTAGNFRDGKPVEARSLKARGKASMAVKRDSQGAASDCYRVRNINGVWRRYVQAKDGWRFVSDHANQDDALAARNPLNEPE